MQFILNKCKCKETKTYKQIRKTNKCIFKCTKNVNLTSCTYMIIHPIYHSTKSF